MPDLSVEDLSKSFPTRAEPLVVLQGVSLELNAGENLAVLGPSGCGKSTLLHILGALDRPTSGTVQVKGENPFLLSDDKLAEFRNRSIGFVFQDHHLLPQCNVLENVLAPTLALGGASPDHVSRADELLEKVGLAERKTHFPAELSGGERQRAAVARALLLRPILLLADEPTGNLDRTNAQRVAELLLDMQRQEQTMLIVVTHSLELADQLNRRLELNEGKLQSAT